MCKKPKFLQGLALRELTLQTRINCFESNESVLYLVNHLCSLSWSGADKLNVGELCAEQLPRRKEALSKSLLMVS